MIGHVDSPYLEPLIYWGLQVSAMLILLLLTY